MNKNKEKNKEKTYTFIWHQNGQKDQIRHNLDKLSTIMISAELRMLYPEEFANKMMSVEVILEN